VIVKKTGLECFDGFTRFAAQRRFCNAVCNGFAHRYHCRDFVHIRCLRANPSEVGGPVNVKIRAQKLRSPSNRSSPN
jgi:hypothetical protein